MPLFQNKSTYDSLSQQTHNLKNVDQQQPLGKMLYKVTLAKYKRSQEDTTVKDSSLPS